MRPKHPGCPRQPPYMLQSFLSNDKIVCPVENCNVRRYRQGERQHVFQHIRSYHDINEVSNEFLLKHLQPCQFCDKPYVVRSSSNGANFLERHMKQCPVASSQTKLQVNDTANIQESVQVSKCLHGGSQDLNVLRYHAVRLVGHS